MSKSTGKTPFEALYGFLPRFERDPVCELTGNVENYMLPSEVQDEIRQKIEVEQRLYKEQYDKRRFKGVTFAIGDIVFVQTNPVATGTSTKLQSVYRGPLVVVEILPVDTYRVKKLNESGDRNFTTTAHVSQLKVWRSNHDSSEDADFEVEQEFKNELGEVDDAIVCSANVTQSNEQDEHVPRRSQRKRKTPEYLKDYVCNPKQKRLSDS